MAGIAAMSAVMLWSIGLVAKQVVVVEAWSGRTRGRSRRRIYGSANT